MSAPHDNEGAPGGPRKGRGALSNRAGRFEALAHEPFDDGWGTIDEPAPRLVTTLTEDASRSVIAHNDSPDVPFESSINPYRGCEHGCIYCFARPTHAWLGLSPGLDFESRLFFKPDAARLLERELARPAYRPSAITLGANTDPYQPVEKRKRVTRAILEVLCAHHHPVSIVTKSSMVERDIDLLAPMAERNLAAVHVSITTLERPLARRMEPRAAAPERRVRTVEALAAASIPVGVLVAPLIPALTDHELETLLATVREAGAWDAGYVLLRLPLEIKDLFWEWLQAHYPDRAEHVMNRMRDMHGGKPYDSTFGVRQRGRGEYAKLLERRFSLARKRLGFPGLPRLDCSQFERPVPQGAQRALF